MATGTRQPNTMEEMLRKVLPAISEMKLADDADFDYIGKLETAVVGKLRQPIDQMAAQGMTAAPPSMAQTAAPGGMAGGGMPPEIAALMGGGGAGGIAPAGPPSPVGATAGQGGLSRGLNSAGAADELRRLLTPR